MSTIMSIENNPISDGMYFTATHGSSNQWSLSVYGSMSSSTPTLVDGMGIRVLMDEGHDADDGAAVFTFSGISVTTFTVVHENSLGVNDAAWSAGDVLYLTVNMGNYEYLRLSHTVSSSSESGGVSYSTDSVTLSASGWSSRNITVSVADVSASSDVIVGPAPTSSKAWGRAGVVCISQSTGTLTFACTVTPTADLVARVIVLQSSTTRAAGVSF